MKVVEFSFSKPVKNNINEKGLHQADLHIELLFIGR